MVPIVRGYHNLRHYCRVKFLSDLLSKVTEMSLRMFSKTSLGENPSKLLSGLSDESIWKRWSSRVPVFCDIHCFRSPALFQKIPLFTLLYEPLRFADVRTFFSLETFSLLLDFVFVFASYLEPYEQILKSIVKHIFLHLSTIIIPPYLLENAMPQALLIRDNAVLWANRILTLPAMKRT